MPQIYTQAFINGVWESSQLGTFDVVNPATGELIAEVADCDAAMATRAVEAAHAAFATWSARPVGERTAIVRKWGELIETHADELAELMTQEQGKPLAEAKGEVLASAQTVYWSASQAERVFGETFPLVQEGVRFQTFKQPVGVVAAITPWNFPHSMVTRKLAPALAVGCTAVLKPSEDTPLSALAVVALAEKAGFPKGVFNAVCAHNPKQVGEVLATHPLVRKISFTGSSQVGKILMEQGAQTLKKLTLELGGNAPAIIFEDADVDLAVNAILSIKCRNAGQVCINVNRLYVARKIYNKVIKELVNTMKQRVVGNGLKAETTVGPLINKKALEKVDALVQDALKKGAKCQLGGAPHALGGNFYTPTILSDVTHDMDIAQQEIFGPVLAVYPFEDEAEVVAKANNIPQGLAAYFYTQSFSRFWRVAEALEAGMVSVNGAPLVASCTPFGGIKESGFGRLGGVYGVEEYMVTKLVAFGGLAKAN